MKKQITYLFFSGIAMLLLQFEAKAQINAQFLGRYSIGNYTSDGGAAEIAAFDPTSKRMFVTNGPDSSLRIVNASNPALPSQISKISIKPYGIDLTSVACKNGLVAVAVIDSNGKTNPSSIVFLDINGNFISKVKVGANADHIVFTPDGSKLLVANEGEPNVGYTIDPEGSISIIDLSGGAASLTQANVQTANFTAFNAPTILHPLIRVYGRIQLGGTFLRNSTVAEDLEPEYITISDDGATAWVTCQENNCIAVVNINTATVTSLLPLGFKNYNVTGAGLDPSDRDGAGSKALANINNWPVFGLFLPDGISSYKANGQQYLVTANEGDARADWGSANNEEVRLSDASYVLDTAKFGGLASNVATLKANAALGRLNVTNRFGDFNNDGKFDSIFTYGGRSFTIWNATTGALVWDSKDDFERNTLARFPANFNAGHNTNALDDRSDNKGPEPESVTVGKIKDSTYAFVALERIGGIMIYNITNPMAPYFVQYINSRNFNVTPNQANIATVGDLGPEGIVFIPASESPNGQNMIMLSNEVSATVALFSITTPETQGITKLQEYKNNTSAPIGTFQGINYREAGFSTLFPIPNTNGTEFWTCSDRGVNIDCANANLAGCRPTYDKMYAFPSYTPKIHRIRIQGDSIHILQTITIKRPNGTGASGIINPTGLGSTASEIASTDTVLNCSNFNLKTTPKDTFGIDPEGLVVDKNGNFWLCEEGGATIWKLDLTGVVTKRYTPYANLAGAQTIDMQIDTVFKYRKNNRGFEGISIAPNGKIYAMIQSPILYPTQTIGDNSRVHRILEIDPTSGNQRMLAYLNDGIIGASGANQIRTSDWKIGDMAAINDSTFLVLESAARGASDIKRLYRININQATSVTSGLYGSLTLEGLIDSTGLANNGIKAVTKTLVMDLLASGWPATLDKAEGLAIINDSTIAIGNDNDFGQKSTLANGIATATGNTSQVITYRLSNTKKLTNYTPPSNLSAFRLQILHASDMESGLDAPIDAPNFAAVMDNLEDTYLNTVRLASGDCFIPSPFLSAGEDPSMQAPLRNTASTYYQGTTAGLRAAIGRTDIAMMNIMGFQGSTFGNHEFDLGTPEINSIIGVDIRSNGVDKRWIGAQFPFLSANLNFSADINLNYLTTTQRLLVDSFKTPVNITNNTQKKGIAPSAVILMNGERVGIVGATTQVLATISSIGATNVISGGSDNMPALAAVLQPAIDSLRLMGINKIILLSHLQQLANEKALAPLLKGVDIIIAGGSHSLCADGNDRIRPGIPVTDKYPILTTNFDNEPLAILNTTSEWKYVGRFVCDFDSLGRLLPNLLDSTINGAYAADTAMVTSLWGSYSAAFVNGTKGNAVRTLTAAISTVINTKDGNISGKSTVFLEGRRSLVRTEETNLGNLSSDANLWYARQIDPQVRVSIKNGGGIRSAIGYVNAVGSTTILENTLANPSAGKARGDISQLDIENSLRFNNGLVIVTTNAFGLKKLLEHGISATVPNTTPGQFPQVGGVTFSYDSTRSANNKIVSLVIIDSLGNKQDTIVRDGKLFGDTTRIYKIVTLNFLANASAPGSLVGGDNYPFPQVVTAQVNLDTAIKVNGTATFAAKGSEQDAFAEYMLARHNTTTSAYSARDTTLQGDKRIQLLNARADSIIFEYPLLTVAQARQVSQATILRTRGIVTRAWGRFIYIQDATGAIAVRQSIGSMVDSILSGGLKEGDSVEIIGTRNDFSNYAQIQLTSGAYNGNNRVTILAKNVTLPTPVVVTLKQINTAGEQYESKLVRVANLRTVATGNFAAGTNYTIWDGTTLGDTMVLRVIAAQDTELDDAPATAIPSGPFTFEGTLIQFCSSPAAGCTLGYQLQGLRKKEIIPQLSSFNLANPANNSKIVTSVASSASIIFNWNKALNATSHKWFVTTATGNYNTPWAVGPKNSDTAFVYSYSQFDTLAATKGVVRGDSILLKWTAYAYLGNDSMVASQSHNIWIVRTPAPIVLGSFNLVSPANNARVEVEQNSTAAININWGASSNSAKYMWFATTPTGSFAAPLLRVPSNNNGNDNMLTLTSGYVDNILASLSVKKGDSAQLKWTVYAYKLNGDSLKASQDFNINIVRKRKLQPFALTSPANNTRLEVEQNQTTPVVINWSASATGATYKWLLDQTSGTSVNPWISLNADNAGSDNKLTLTAGAIDDLLSSKSIPDGDSILLKWTVRAYEEADSLQASQTFNLLVLRKKAVGLGEINTNRFMKLYPNPTNGNSTLSFTLQTSEELIISVADIQGKLLLDKINVNGVSGMNEIELPTANVQDGIYFVSLTSNGKSDKIKLVVIH